MLESMSIKKIWTDKGVRFSMEQDINSNFFKVQPGSLCNVGVHVSYE